jgi:predicted RNA-binding protein Jag
MRKTDMRCRIVVDVEDYKKRQQAGSSPEAREVAKRRPDGSLRGDGAHDAYDRKMVHDAVATVEGVERESREDPERRVVIAASDRRRAPRP